MAVKVTVLTEADAREVASWRYEPPYELYSGSRVGIIAMIEPANRYFAIRRDGELIGYVCVGPEARVPGLGAEPGVDDIGLGLRPDVTGRGRFRALFPEVIAQLADEFREDRQRVVIAAWNARAQAAARAVGFTVAGSHTNESGVYLLLTRPRP